MTIKNGTAAVLAAMLVLAPAALTAQDMRAENEAITKDPVYVIQTRINNNYMSLKKLYVPIRNFGGGEAEFNRLLDGYSIALALYLNGRVEEAGEHFARNESDIRAAADGLAKKYREQAERLHAETVKLHIASKMKKSLDGRTIEVEPSLYTSGDAWMENASDSLRLANRQIREGRPVEAIYYFRKAKDSCFEAIAAYRVEVPESYKIDRDDNRNVLYAGDGKAKACTAC